MKIQSYRDLDVWKKSIQLTKHCYQLSEAFPKKEQYNLTSQLRRSAISIPSNIAEGRSRSSTKEYLRFVDIAYGSLAELETQLILAQELGYLLQEPLTQTLQETSEIGRMLNGLSSSLQRKLSPDLRPLTSEPLSLNKETP